MDFGIAETGFARGSPPGTTTEVLRVGFPIAEIRVVSSINHYDAIPNDIMCPSEFKYANRYKAQLSI
jgi:hypothetical protein